jgi:HAD superfamily hydrolase (TIGR01509 family)
MTLPAAVLFDLDGTLIDSEPVWGAAMRTLARSRGVEVPEDLLVRISGLDATLAMEFVHGELGWSGRGIAADVAFLMDRVRDTYIRELVWRPGAAELLAAVRRSGLPTGLVTSTYRPLVDVVLSIVGKDNFDVVVCGDDGHAPKPSPASYVAATSALGLPAASCVAFEDSSRGVASARAAGCVVVQVSPLASGDAHLHVPSLDDPSIAMLLSGARDVAGAAAERVEAQYAVEMVDLV